MDATRVEQPRTTLEPAPKGPPLINVLAAAAAKVQDGAACIGAHSRLPGAPGNALVRLMGKLVASEKFRAEINNKKQLTVDDSATVPGTSISVHCTVLPDGVVLLVCTKQEYPRRLIFPPVDADLEGGRRELLPSLAREVQAGLGPSVLRPTPGTALRPEKLPASVSQGVENVCAEFDDPARAGDKVAQVQQQVNAVKEQMQDNVNAMLQNADQLSLLQSSAEKAADSSKAFKATATEAKNEFRCQHHKMNFIIFGALAVALVAVLFFTGILGGGGAAPSPPPPMTTTAAPTTVPVAVSLEPPAAALE